MFKTKKILNFSLGALAFSAPLATVIACSNGQTDKTFDDYAEKFGQLTSKEAKNALELTWLDSVIKSFNKDFDIEKPWENANVQKLIKFFIAEQIRKDSTYLLKLSKQLLSIVDKDKNLIYNIGDNDEKDLKLLGFLQEYANGYNQTFFEETISGLSKQRIELIAQVLMKERALDFSNKIYKYLIVANYLKIDKSTFEKYRKLQDEKKYNFTLQEDLINDGENFLLIKKMLEKRLFFKWEIKETTDGNKFINVSKQKIEEALKQFILNKNGKNETIADYSNYETKKQQLNKSIWDFKGPITLKVKDDKGNDKEITIELYTYYGYKGIVSQEKGFGKLDFSLEELKKSTKEYWIGILKTRKDTSKNELITDGISLIPEDAENNMATLIFLIGIMPIWDKENEKLTMVGSHFEKHIDSIAWLLYANDESIYNEALKYYADEKDKGGQGIKVEVAHEQLRKHWKDVEKLPFIK